MRADTKPRPTEPACSFDTFLSVLDNAAPAFTGIPRTLRAHIGAREFGNFGTVLMAERPASDDLSKHVERLRGFDAAPREDLPLQPHADRATEDRLFNIVFVLTPIVIMLWVLISLLAAWLKGAL